MIHLAAPSSGPKMNQNAAQPVPIVCERFEILRRPAEPGSARLGTSRTSGRSSSG
jgi:hypothetical protein